MFKLYFMKICHIILYISCNCFINVNRFERTLGVNIHLLEISLLIYQLCLVYNNYVYNIARE